MQRSQMALAFVAAAAAVSGCATPAGGASQPVPVGAVFSADEAVKVVFDSICVPAILEGKPVADLAKARGLVEVQANLKQGGPNDRTYGFPSLSHALVTAWADGTCMISIDKGDAPALRAKLITTLESKSLVIHPGSTVPADNAGEKTAYCSADRPPIVLGVITPRNPDKPGKRAALVANLFRAKSGNPEFCRPKTEKPKPTSANDPI